MNSVCSNGLFARFRPQSKNAVAMPLLVNFDQLFAFGERTLNPSPSHGIEQRHAKTPFQAHTDIS
jgi:hypothetical protein